MICGLAMNAQRAETRKANRVRAGIVAAFAAKLDRGWFAALAEADDEAEAMYQRHAAEVDRQAAEMEIIRTNAAHAAVEA